jgi:predicted DNA-binding antitoxin AbrB/MazE fold protein
VTTVEGVVKNGVVVPGQPINVPDGTRVQIAIQDAEAPHAWMLKFAGVASDLPPDFADQHDHYIHGTPKR